MSKTVVIVPIKQKSERVKGKNLLKFGKKKNLRNKFKKN